MTDLETLRQALLKIKCEFTCDNTFIGFTISVYSEVHEMQFEFCNKGKFIRTITV